MLRKEKPLFERGKTYYAGHENLKVKYSHLDTDGYHVFKVLEHAELDEFCTKLPDDIYSNKTEYNKAVKSQQNQVVVKEPEMMSI
jgi:hypothetical protein